MIINTPRNKDKLCKGAKQLKERKRQTYKQNHRQLDSQKQRHLQTDKYTLTIEQAKGGHTEKENEGR